MELQDSVLKAFADAVNGSGSTSPDAITFYAIVVRKTPNQSTGKDDIFVRFYGADESTETPANTVVEVGVGDVVMVRMKDHKVTIIGNISYPALTRVGDIYITLTADGLVIGRLNEHNVPTGTHILITNTNFQLIGANGAVLAKFGSNVELGPEGSVRSTINSQGLKVFNSSGTMIAQFGATAQIGPSNSAHVIINGSNMIFYNASRAEVLRAGTSTSTWNGFKGIETQGNIVANDGRVLAYLSGANSNGRVTAGSGALIADLSGGMPIPERDVELIASKNWVGLYSHNNPYGWISYYNLSNKQGYLYSHMDGNSADVVAVPNLLRGGVSQIWSGTLSVTANSTDWSEVTVSALANWNVAALRVHCGRIYSTVIVIRSEGSTEHRVGDYDYTYNGTSQTFIASVRVNWAAGPTIGIKRVVGPADSGATQYFQILAVHGIVRAVG